MDRGFDAYCLVDFSARSSPSPVRPSADAAWMGCAGARGRVAVSYHRTRSALMRSWSGWVQAQVQPGRRVLCGFDFALGYPAGFARAAGLEPGGWSAVWRHLADHIQDDEHNRNNRWAVAAELNRCIGGAGAVGPFWGCVRGVTEPGLSAKRGFDWPFAAKDGTALPRLRATERCCAGAQEAWKLAGIGSVGSQSLLGIAALQRELDRAAWASAARVWPMQTGFLATPWDDTNGKKPSTQVLIAEAYPSLLGEAVEALREKHGGIRDAAQADAWCRWARREDAAGRLGQWLAMPAGLSPADARAAVAEEGWILGVRGPGAG